MEGRGEAPAVLGGTDAEGPQECAAHRLGGTEAAVGGYGSEWFLGVFEGAPGCLQAQALDVAGGGDAGLRAEAAGEVTRAHVRAVGQRLHGEVKGQVLDGEALDVAQAVALRGLGGERGAELGLVGRAA